MCFLAFPHVFDRGPDSFVVWFPSSEKLRARVHDTDEGVRQEVVSALASAAKKDISNISDEMLTLIKDRTLDKKVRRGEGVNLLKYT